MARISKNEFYVKNADLLRELIEYRNTGTVSEELGKMLLLIARNLSSKGNWNGYTWRQDMCAEATLTCVKYLKNFDAERSQNAFAYITQICNNSFKAYIKSERKHSEIKNSCYEGYDELIGAVEYDIHSERRSINYEILNREPSKKSKELKT